MGLVVRYKNPLKKIFYFIFLLQNQLHYQLKNLKKNTDYFIQVQALASYGRNSIKSKMAKMIFRTSKLENQYEMPDF